MARNILDFNAEYTYKQWRAEEEAAAHPRKGAAVRTAIFYALLVGMVLFAFIYSGSEQGAGKKFGPFAYNTILSSSMKSVYPKGSLVVSWAVKPDEPLAAGLNNGDDIVFAREDGTVIAHRIIEVMEDYEDSGQRAFRTQGTDNPEPDPWITGEVNVVGKVVWHMPVAGDVLAFIAENIFWVLGGILGIFLLLALVKQLTIDD